MFVSIELVKQHLNIDEYYHDDDEYLKHLILVAETVVEKHIDCDFSVLLDEVGMIPSPLLHAILLFIGNMYQSRESVSFSSATEVPLSFRYLLDLYMNYAAPNVHELRCSKHEDCHHTTPLLHLSKKNHRHKACEQDY